MGPHDLAEARQLPPLHLPTPPLGCHWCSQEELQGTLAQRRLEAEGSRAELEARLAAFLAAPTQHPQADCSPTHDVRVVGGRLFGGVPPLRRHIQLLFELLQVRSGMDVIIGNCTTGRVCGLGL